MYPIVFFLLALTFAFLHIYRHRHAFSIKQKIQTFLLSIIFFNIGCAGILGFFGHAFMADEIAREIGWPTGNPFQFEVAVCNLAFGVLGVISFLFRPAFWLAVVLGNLIFLFGAAWGHYVQWSQYGDVAPYNWGVFVFAGDIALPLIYGALMIFYYFRYEYSNDGTVPR